MWDVVSAITVAWHIGYCGSGVTKVVRERGEREKGNREIERNWDFEIFRSDGFAEG